VRKQDVRQGTFIRLLSNYLRLPAGTLATVDSVGTLSNGEFFFTVRWLNPPSGTRSRPVSDRSLNLWESDLEKFECVSNEEAEGIFAVSRPVRQRKINVRGNPSQLRLLDDM
jgi:hypothetical protein